MWEGVWHLLLIAPHTHSSNKGLDLEQRGGGRENQSWQGEDRAMSSSDASDLVDSDDASTSQQSQRFMLVGKDDESSTGTRRAPAQGGSTSIAAKRPTKESESGGGAASASPPVKKRRLELGFRLSPDAAGSRSMPGKNGQLSNRKS